MKTTMILLSLAVTIFSTAALPNPFLGENASEHVARKVMAAFKKSSPEAYIALFPTLEEFYKTMDENAAIYGNNLEAAKAEFSERYENEILPALRNSFSSVIRDGNEKGIDWSTATYERTEYNTPKSDLESTPLTIVFSSNGKEYRIRLENAFMLRKEWKVSQDIALL